MAKRSIPEVLSDAADALKTAESGLRQLLDDAPERKVPGLRNLIVFGGAVSRVLDELSRTDPGFDDLFHQTVSAMAADPMMQDFDRLRAEILREQKLEISVTHLRLPSAGASFGPRPPHARAFFTGDRLGGTGWEVALPDGSIEKYYVALSEKLRPVSFRFEAENPGPDSVESLSRKYLLHLKEMFRNAKEYFSG